MRLWMIVLLIGVLAACGSPVNPDLPPTIDPAIIRWDRRADAVIFRADVIGGANEFRARSDIPLCTIFGDNRVLWVNELDGFHFEVLYDAVSDNDIRSFISYLTAQEEIYTFGWNADSLFATAEVAPVIETITLTVNDVTHRSDSFSGWDAEKFRRMLTMCKGLARAPILFQPSGAWITVQRMERNVQAPISLWDSDVMGFSLPSADGAQPRWMTGTAMLSLWEQLRSLPSSLLYTEDFTNYYGIALQVPGVTRDAPPTP